MTGDLHEHSDLLRVGFNGSQDIEFLSQHEFCFVMFCR